MEKKPALMRAFSSLFIASVNDDVLQRYSLQLDLKTHGLVCYRRLTEQFSFKVDVDPSAEEVLLQTLSKNLGRNPTMPAVDQFLRETVDTLGVFQRTADSSSGPPPVVERLLVLHVIQQLSVFPWAATVFSPFLSSVRSEEVRRQTTTPVSASVSLQAVVDKVRTVVSAQPSVMSQQRQCTFCGRGGHTAAQCWDREREPGTAAGSHRRRGRPGQANAVQRDTDGDYDGVSFDA
jgi:hypothetical protein